MTVINWRYEIQANRFVAEHDPTHIDIRSKLEQIVDAKFNTEGRSQNSKKLDSQHLPTDSKDENVGDCTNQEVLEEHYTRMKPTLQGIINRGVENGLLDAPTVRESTVNFYERDIRNSLFPNQNDLLSGQHIQNREVLIAELRAHQHGISSSINSVDESSFFGLINKSSEEKLTDLQSFRTQLSEDSALMARFTELQQNSVGFIEDLSYSEQYALFIDKLSDVFNEYSPKTLSEIALFAQVHEQTALVLFEPTLLYVVGPTLFMKFLLPLHRDLAFSMVIRDAIAVQSLKHNLKYRYRAVYQSSTRAITLFSNTCYKNRGLILCSSTLGTVVSLFNFNRQLPTNGNNALINRIPEGQGFQGRLGANMLIARQFVQASTYEVARIIGAGTRGVYMGIIDTNRPLIIALSEFLTAILKRKN